MSRFIAVDVGAESGRLIVGTLEDDLLTIEEAHRFANGSVSLRGNLYWDILKIFSEIKVGLRKIGEAYGTDFVSAGIDTWALDFGLLDSNGNLLSNPRCYRDSRTTGMMEKAFSLVPKEDIFNETAGIQFLIINPLYHLLAMTESDKFLLDNANDFLMIPDLLNFWLTGKKVCEYTNATTTQFFDSRHQDWSYELLNRFGIPHHFLPEIVLPGTNLGNLIPEVANEVGFEQLPIIAVATHDTASAVAGVPSEADDFAWLSSGTWSLLGGIATEAIVTREALEYNFSSYGGVGGSVLPWKNIMGLWLVQECRRIWVRQGDEYSYDKITQLAQEARPFVAIIDPDDVTFLAPDNMPSAIQAYCQNTGQTIPESHSEILRTALESLALRYRWVLEKLEELVGHSYDKLYVVGGGSQNSFLNQLTADAIGKPVISGPVEATAMGNILVQAVATGHLASMEQAREVIRKSTQTQEFTPKPDSKWNEMYTKFVELTT